jgi:hypothetical protein
MNKINHLKKYFLKKIQWAPLNGITLGPIQTDPINRMIPLTEQHFGINSKQDMEISKKMIPLTE